MMRLTGSLRNIEGACDDATNRSDIRPVVNNRRRYRGWRDGGGVRQRPRRKHERAWWLAGDLWVWIPVDRWIDGNYTAAVTIITTTAAVAAVTTASTSVASIVQVNGLIHRSVKASRMTSMQY